MSHMGARKNSRAVVLGSAADYVIETMGTNGEVSALPLPPSARLCEVLWLVLKGHKPPAIAHKLSRSINTIKKHLAALYELYDVHDEHELTSLFVEAAALTQLENRIRSLRELPNYAGVRMVLTVRRRIIPTSPAPSRSGPAVARLARGTGNG